MKKIILYVSLFSFLFFSCTNTSDNSGGYSNNEANVTEIVTIREIENDNNTKNIILETKTVGATIYYTTDNSIPTSSSDVYSVPLIISEETTIKAFATKNGLGSSPVSTYLVTFPKTYIVNAANYKNIIGNITNVSSTTIKVVGNFSNSEYLSDIKQCLTNKKIKFALDLSEAQGIYIGKWQFYNCSYITEIILPEGVSIINEQAFYGCENLKNITLPSTLTEVCYKAFYGCPNISTVTYLGTINQWLKITFNTDRGLPLENTKKFIINGTEIVNLVIPDNVTRIERFAFYGCSTIESVSFPNTLTFIGADSFYYCDGIKELTIPNSVTTIESGAFMCCTTLTKINLPNTIDKISDKLFQGCNKLENIELPATIKSIGENSFYYCKELKEITIPLNVTSIGTCAFESSGLEKAIFKSNSNWKYGTVKIPEIGQITVNPIGTINYSELQDFSTAANYLKNTYFKYYWYKY